MRTATLALLAALALGPTVGAGAPFVLAYEDPHGDVPAPSVDIVRVLSSVADGLVTQRVEMAAPPDLVQDTVILRSWLHDSTNGSFHTLDLEVHARGEGDARFRAVMRSGEFENVTEVSATHTVDGNAWVFFFAESLVADATCFDPIVWAQHEPDNGSWAADQGGVGTRYCRVRGDPYPTPAGRAADAPPPVVPRSSRETRETGVVLVPPRAPGERAPDPPGTHIASPSLALVAGVLVVGALLTHRTWRRK